MFVSLTRLRLRSFWYLLPFQWYIYRTRKQIEGAEGFVTGKLLVDARLTFWTVTGWQSQKDMKAYRDSGPHHQVMPQLRRWCDEAAVAHWEQSGNLLPDWNQAYQRLASEGRLSPVLHPSEEHSQKQFREPRANSRLEAVMKPSGK
jgi:hypothetical protein